MKLNKKGFTLIELIATIVVLGIVASIGAYSISAVIQNSKDKNYELLVENIKTAAEMFYQDCKYITGNVSDSNNECHFDSDGALNVELSKLVASGFLSSNKTKDQTGVLYNPKNDEEITNCKIRIIKLDKNITVTSTSTGNSNCPTY